MESGVGDLQKIENSFGKKVVIATFGEEEGGWCSKGVRGGFEVGVWEAVTNEWEGIRNNSLFKVGNERRVRVKLCGARIKHLKRPSLTYILC